MKTLLITLFAALALTACGGRLDESGNPVDDDSDSADAQAQELRAVSPVLTPAPTPVVGAPPRRADRLPADPRADLVGKEPVLELDFSDGRIRARLAAPDFAARHLYSVEHQGGRCTCH